MFTLGLGPIGQMSARIARHRGAGQVFGIDLVAERLKAAADHGIETFDLNEHDDLAVELRERTGGRGPDSVIDAVGMEAHGSGAAKAAQAFVGLLPDAVASPMMQKAGVDRLGAILAGIDIVRRGGTLSISGVYGGNVDPLPLLQMFDNSSTSGWARPTSSGGSTTSCRSSATTTRWASTTWPPTAFPSTRPPGLCHLPEEAGRRHQGHLHALTSRLG